MKKFVNGEYIEMTAEEIAELAELQDMQIDTDTISKLKEAISALKDEIASLKGDRL